MLAQIWTPKRPKGFCFRSYKLQHTIVELHTLHLRGKAISIPLHNLVGYPVQLLHKFHRCFVSSVLRVEMSNLWAQEIACALHLARVICEFDAISAVNLGKFNDRIESSTFLRIAAALRLEIVHKECSNSKGTWKTI